MERFRVTCKTNGRNDHVTMFILHLSLAVFSFSVKLSSFALASKVRICLLYSHPCSNFSNVLIMSSKHKRESHVCRKHDSKSL